MSRVTPSQLIVHTALTLLTGALVILIIRFLLARS